MLAILYERWEDRVAEGVRQRVQRSAELQLFSFQPRARPQQPTISASTLRTTLSQLSSKGMARSWTSVESSRCSLGSRGRPLCTHPYTRAPTCLCTSRGFVVVLWTKGLNGRILCFLHVEKVHSLHQRSLLSCQALKLFKVPVRRREDLLPCPCSTAEIFAQARTSRLDGIKGTHETGNQPITALPEVHCNGRKERLLRE